MTRTVRIEDGVAYVPLTRGHTAIIDAADATLVAKYSWWADVRSHAVYARCVLRNHDGSRATMYLHRAIMGSDPRQVDHIDRNGLNNRRSNLRFATTSENMRNSRTPRSNSSGLKGVSWHKRDAKWHAQIKVAGRKIHLGYFDSSTEAHAAYCAASAEHHGAFGRTA